MGQILHGRRDQAYLELLWPHKPAFELRLQGQVDMAMLIKVSMSRSSVGVMPHLCRHRCGLEYDDFLPYKPLCSYWACVKFHFITMPIILIILIIIIHLYYLLYYMYVIIIQIQFLHSSSICLHGKIIMP